MNDKLALRILDDLGFVTRFRCNNLKDCPERTPTLQEKQNKIYWVCPVKKFRRVLAPLEMRKGLNVGNIYLSPGELVALLMYYFPEDVPARII